MIRRSSSGLWPLSRIVAVLALMMAVPAASAAAQATGAAAQAIGAAETDRPADTVWTPALSMRYRQITQTTLSADGRLVAYVVRSPDMKGTESRYVSQVWVAAADGSWNRQYTRGPKGASSPTFSPDGSRLAFLSSREAGTADENDEGAGKTQVWVMQLGGGEAWQLTDAPTGVDAFAWSPSGDRIAYTSADTISGLRRQQEKEKRDELVVDSVFQEAHLYVVALAANADGTHAVTRLTSGDFNVRGFDWSPDGTTIVFAHQSDPRINTIFLHGDISVVPSTGGEVRPLVTGAGVYADPHYSPDGRMIAFTSSGDQPEPVGLADVWTVPAAGGAPHKLADTPDRSASIVSWSADGRTIWVEEVVHTQGALIALPADGSPARTMVPPTGTLGDLALDRAGDLASFTWQDLDTPSDVYVSPTSKLDMKKLSSVNADVPKPPMGRTELVSWKSKDGKFTIEGLLTYPVGYVNGRHYPFVLNVHGGPAGVFTQGFTGNPSIYMIQYFAQNGYAVLRANPRGSTGYGKAFRYANVKDWGGGDYQDLMAGVDHVVAMGVADPDSLVEMGWSYGGYMTSWIITQTHRFKAVSMGAGLPDLVSMVYASDIPAYLIAGMGGVQLWQDYKLYQAHSAMYRVADIKTPTQIMLGAVDVRVPTTQGYELYGALKHLGVPTELVRFPRTPHGPQEPKLLMDVSPHILGWFDHWLGRNGGGAAAASARPGR
jgi:dipeptidyl aminopeptidase/acylaminoacyl peptidase